MSPAATDPFGLRSLDVADLRRRTGAKWHRPAGRLAAWLADMDFPVGPSIRERLTGLAAGDLGYPDWPHPDTSPLPELFDDRMTQRYGWRVGVERLHELCDVVQGIRIAVHHLTQPGDGVVVHTPAYPPFLDTVHSRRRRLVPVPWPFDHDALEARLRDEPARLMILCHPHNPTGHVFDRVELEQIAELADRHDLTVVSDEIHADLTYAPKRHVPFAALGDDVAARTVTVTSASKAFNLAGLRWAILHAGSQELHRAIQALPRHYLGTPNVMAVAATEAAWAGGEQWLAAVLEVLDENRHALTTLLADHLPGTAYRVPDATYLAWIDCRGLGFVDDPAEEFRRRGVELSPGPAFGAEGEGHVRLNLATSPAVLQKIAATMAG